ncbi:c-type cytochrome biogenesis protein CcsB [Georgenia sunbinii]|uniref:c-type cytochrome biogenesis protein CcsB n=1 Tax=Georgenia sunbinii TaxID=3117728 RepID=UPI002F263CC3
MNDLGQLSTVLIYAAMAAYAVAMVAFGIDLTRLRDGGPTDRPRKAVGVAMTTTTLGAALHLVGVVLRGVAAGRVPWANMYEFSIVFTLVAVLTFLGIQRWRDMRFLGAFVITPTLLGLGLAVAVFYLDADGVRPALDNYWLIIHVSVATLAVGILSVAAAISVVQLIKERGEIAARAEAPAGADAVEGAAASASLESAGTTTTTRVAAPVGGSGGGGFWRRFAATLPGSVELERLAYRLNAIGFLLWTFTVVAGAIWAEHAWGRPWGWDPKEVWSFVIWVAYAAYLHARATRGWDGRKAAYFCLAGFALILGNYFIVNLLLDTEHGYAF